ncbi:MAG: hypothetical protein BalsKO_23270 [Balneolaceae bacterium]
MERIFHASFKDIFSLSIQIGKSLFTLFSIFGVANFFLYGFSFETLLDSIFISLFLPLIVTFLISVTVFCLGSLFTVKIYSNEISATNFWGRRLIFHWKELKSVKLTKVSGFDYLIFTNEDDRRIWIPLLIGDLNLFINSVLERTKLLNPGFYKKFLDLVDEEAGK